MASVRFENVSISYGAKQVVKDFSLSVNNGEIMGIIGPSGCGKTTLIRALCGLIKPDKGSIYIADQLVFSDEKRVNIAPERRCVAGLCGVAASVRLGQRLLPDEKAQGAQGGNRQARGLRA